MKKFMIGLVLPLTGVVCWGQSPPDVLNDPIWVPVASMTDEFNDSVIDNTKWTWAPPWGTYHGHPDETQACLTTDPANRREENGVLKLVVTNDTTTCYKWDGTPYTKPYSSGALYSKDTIKYGYFIARVKIPDNAANTTGYGPNFWFWKLLDPLYGKWSEIDVYEFDASSNTHTCNVHYESDYVSPVVTDHWSMREVYGSTYDTQIEFNNQWHTFACQWGPERIDFYIDGQYLTGISSYSSDQNYLNMIFDINVPAKNFNYTSLPANPLLPYTYEIDYVRTYRMQMDCNTIQAECGWIPESYEALKKVIYFNNNCSTVVPSGSHVLRTTDHVHIAGDFTVNSGTELLLQTGITCY